jgi:hypothetical protein
MKTSGQFTKQLWASMIAVVCGAAFFLSPSPVCGQVVNARLAGTIMDSTNAVIPGASVTLTSLATDLAIKTTSNEVGGYSFPVVPPGIYKLSVEKEGFKSTVMSSIELLVNQQASVDVRMEVGAVTTVVEVTGAAPMVEATTASVGAVIGERETTQLPLNLRRYGSLAILVPGTMPDNGGTAGSTFGSPFSETTYSANGARTSSNNYLIDAVDSVNIVNGGFAVQPPPDAVEEFKIQTNLYSAAFGRQAGSTINLVTKSGTNEFHGVVYEFLRNDKLDARNYFVADVARYRRNQFGFSAGGPIRRHKTFWFVNYEGLRDIKASQSRGVVPTAAMKGGDLSSYLTGNTFNLCGSGGPTNLDFDTGQLFDPGTLEYFTCPAGSESAGQNILVGTPYAGNVITNINPVAQRVLDENIIPDPNQPGRYNYINNLPSTRNDDELLARVDHTFGSNDRLNGRYILGQSLSHVNAKSPFPGFREAYRFRGQNLGLSWTRNFGSALMNEARFGFQRNYSTAACGTCPRAPGFMESFGVENLKAFGSDFEGHPFFTISRFSGIGDRTYRPLTYPDMVEKYQDNLTWVHGKHTVVVGADLQFWQQLHMATPVAVYGYLTTNGQYSSLGRLVPGVNDVSGFADFLAGYPSSGGHSVRFQPANFVGGGFWNLYAQDDFKISPGVALNIGIRYEYRRYPVDKRDYLMTFVPTGPAFSGPGNGTLVTAMDDATNDALCTDPAFSYMNSSDGRCLIASSTQRQGFGFTGRSRRSLVLPGPQTWAPRLGLSFRPTHSDKFILRAGYGIFYDFLPTENLIFVQNGPLMTPTGTYTTPFGAPPPTLDGVPITYETMFAGAPIAPVVEQFLSMYVTPHYDTPYLQQWSFGISSQFASEWALEVDYIGNKGTHQGNLHWGNQPSPGVGDWQARRPYPDFGSTLYTSADVNTFYHALQTRLTKRLSSGLSFLMSYTFGKSINDGEGNEGFGGGNGGNVGAQDDNNIRADRGRSYVDARHRFVVSYIWDLPFGAGKRYLNRRGWQNHIVGGWQVSGITSLQSGFPMTIFPDQDYSNTGSMSPRPDRLCHGDGPKTLEMWYDPSCFTNAALQDALANGQPRFGNSGRNILNAPGFLGWDFALLKNFRIGDRLGLEFRAEAYSLLNHLNPGYPDPTIGSPTAGQIFDGSGERELQFGLKLRF